MQYHYQLIFLGNTENPLIRDILNVFIKKIGELGLSEKILKIIYSYEFDEKYNNKNPSFCFYIEVKMCIMLMWKKLKQF